MKILRIDEEDLYDQDDYCPYWNGEKFTGIGYEIGTNGVIYRETSYKNGVQDGIYQEFSDRGTLLEKGYFKNGYAYGIWKKWNEAGQLISLEIFNRSGKIYGEKRDSEGFIFCKKYTQKLGTRIVNKYSKEELFFRSGNLKEERIYEYEILVKARKWNLDGDWIEDYHIDKDHPSHKYLVSYAKDSTSDNPFVFSK